METFAERLTTAIIAKRLNSPEALATWLEEMAE